MFGSGSVYYVGIPAAALGSTDAVNGLSIENAKVVLGQSLGTAGDPAILLDNREIPIDTFSVLLRQGAFGTSSSGAISVMIDGNVGGLFHGFVAECVNLQSGTILYRGTHDDLNCNGAIIQLECTADTGVAQFAVWGNNAGIVAYRKNAAGIISSAVTNPDIVFQANTKGAPTNRPGDVVMATNRLGTETETYRFIPPVSIALNFPNTLAQTSSDLTVAVIGAKLGDAVALGVPNAAVNANSSYSAWVSAADQVTVRFNNYSAAAIDPANATFKVGVIGLLQ
jgi:hypothetical protein